METQNHGLHILFFPFMAPSHMLPMLDMAKLFARRGVKVTILTTPANAAHIQLTDKLSVELELIPFPSSAVGLPAGCENLAAVPEEKLDDNFMEAVAMLRQPFHQVLLKLHPNAVIADNFLPWTIKLASNLRIPNLIFNSTGFFPLCVLNSMEKFNPGEELAESFVVPGLPHRIELLKSQLPEMRIDKPAFAHLFTEIKEQEPGSYGTVVNSFYELEPDYVEHYRTVMGRRAWHIGPLSLFNENIDSDSMRADEYCLAWLEEKQPGSVLYVCLGSLCAFSAEQLREMALGFEASSKHPFIWVLPKVAKNDEEMDWMPEGYEERIEGKGLIMRRWAPQVQILNHRAVGGFLTHCGWNSILEGVSAGVPMITWPLFAEQFYNERLIVDVLGIGVAVGSKDWTWDCEKRSVIDAGVIEKAVALLMSGGEEAEDMRKRARELAAMAKRAVEKGRGSSDKDISSLIHELLSLKSEPEDWVSPPAFELF